MKLGLIIFYILLKIKVKSFLCLNASPWRRIGRVEIRLHEFLTSELDLDEPLVSCSPCGFVPGEKNPRNCRLGEPLSWSECDSKEKNTCHWLEYKPGLPDRRNSHPISVITERSGCSLMSCGVEFFTQRIREASLCIMGRTISISRDLFRSTSRYCPSPVQYAVTHLVSLFPVSKWHHIIHQV